MRVIRVAEVEGGSGGCRDLREWAWLIQGTEIRWVHDQGEWERAGCEARELRRGQAIRPWRTLNFYFNYKEIDGGFETNMIHIKTKTPPGSGGWSKVGMNGGGSPVKRPALAQRRDAGSWIKVKQWHWRSGQVGGYILSQNQRADRLETVVMISKVLQEQSCRRPREIDLGKYNYLLKWVDPNNTKL